MRHLAVQFLKFIFIIALEFCLFLLKSGGNWPGDPIETCIDIFGPHLLKEAQ